MAYCAGLKGELSRCPKFSLGRIEDASRTGDERRKRDLEATFLSFPVTTGDGRFHDGETKEDFNVAFLPAGQVWDQVEARAQEQRRKSREEGFRHRLARLLQGPAYTGIDATTKERLLAEVPALAFAKRGIGF